VRLRPKSPQYDRDIDGLVIGGGTDLYPPLFKIDPNPHYNYDHDRDALEIKWLERAEEHNMPVLGICRGAQLLNVQRGGTLHVDVSKVYENARYPANIFANIFFRKAINIEPESALKNIFKTQRLQVNSMHKQSIDTLGHGFAVSAKEDNGVVQAIEDRSRAFCMGVQFHPEALIYKSIFRALFKCFVNAAKERKI